MRLKYLKLAGFKSFVDPTKIEFTQALSAVVGPNGCGKSNIIDAVRWVLGESSAKNLRGEGMTDVIFNGSSARKPISTASVELMFDNSDGAAVGPWASFTDISIKRQVSRDGQSDYYVNGQKCRRRDISDLLSGTGLGPRSYAIIEQGTISRLVESKPQELRVFIEEAAGISKYKERKRDAENRIRHSRENLSRLADLRHELEGQIASLETQANLAQDYTDHKKQERELNQNIVVARWQSFFNELSQVDITLAQQQVQMGQVESDLAQLQASEQQRSSSLSQQRQMLHALTNDCHQIETEIARVKLSIEHLTQRRQQGENKQSALSLKLEALNQQRQHQSDSLSQAEQLLEESSLALPILQQNLSGSDKALAQHEHDSEHNEHSFNELQQEKQRINGELLVARQSSEQLSKDHIKLVSQLEHSANKQLELIAAQQKLSPKNLEQQMQQEQQLVSSATLAHQQSEQGIINARQIAATQHSVVNERQLQLAQLENRRSTLELMIKGQVKPQTQQLAQHYDDTRQLWQLLTVEPLWQAAAQTVLKPYLNAFVVEQLSGLDTLPRHTVLAKSLSISTPATQYRLSDFIQSTDIAVNDVITSLCRHIHVASDLAQATAILESLNDSESVVTMDGTWLSHHFCVIGQDNEQAENTGLLALKQQLEQLQPQIDNGQSNLSEARRQEECTKLDLTNALSEKESCYKLMQTAQHTMLATKQRWLLEQQQWQHLVTNLDEVIAMHQQNSQLLALEKQQLQDYQTDIKRLAKVLSSVDEQLKLAQSSRQIAKQQVKILQNKQQQDQQKVHQQQMLVQKHQLKHDNCTTQLASIDGQRTELGQEVVALTSELDAQVAPLQQHQEKLKLHNQQLFDKKSAQQQQIELVDTVTKASAGFSEQWQVEGQKKDKLQSQIEKLRVKKETLKVKILAQQQVLEISEREMAVLAQALNGQDLVKEWHQQLSDIRDKLAAMGAINLTAIEQYNEQKSRLDYLTAQNDDLEQGLKTLESAIRKIDRQTREKFKATFDSVNQDFKKLFPKVFGGGSAQLTLTDSDLLLSGVSIMAQPPGKKNSTIALLSGGEKALTALSLVFAIFQLNPAPFCMLDEVDAPLDDANVERYCNLVKEMSEKVQFIYITHNKVSMEMATQLTGVTMQEPGISRVVTVDVDAAVSLAQQ